MMCMSTTCSEKRGSNGAITLVMKGRTVASRGQPTSVSVCHKRSSEHLSLLLRLALLEHVFGPITSLPCLPNLLTRSLLFIFLTLHLPPTATRTTYTFTATITRVILLLWTRSLF